MTSLSVEARENLLRLLSLGVFRMGRDSLAEWYSISSSEASATLIIEETPEISFGRIAFTNQA